MNLSLINPKFNLTRLYAFIVLLMSVPVAMELERTVGVMGGTLAIALLLTLAALVESIVRGYFITVAYSFYKEIKEKEALSSSLRDIATPPRDVEIRNGTYKIPRTEQNRQSKSPISIPRPLYKKF